VVLELELLEEAGGLSRRRGCSVVLLELLLVPGLTFRLPLALPLTPGPLVELELELSGPVATRGGASLVVLLLELDEPGAAAA